MYLYISPTMYLKISSSAVTHINNNNNNVCDIISNQPVYSAVSSIFQFTLFTLPFTFDVHPVTFGHKLRHWPIVTRTYIEKFDSVTGTSRLPAVSLLLYSTNVHRCTNELVFTALAPFIPDSHVIQRPTIQSSTKLKWKS